MHVLLHFDPDLPAILSERADGDLNLLRSICAHDPARPDWLTLPLTATSTALCPPPLWIRIAAQIVSALAYIHDCTRLAHLDLKPGNILFQCTDGLNGGGAGGEGPVRIRCMLSDYGICAPKTDRINAKFRRFPGTAAYNPPVVSDLPLWNGDGPDTEDADAREGTMHQLSLYQCAMTLLDLLLVVGGTDGGPGRFFARDWVGRVDLPLEVHGSPSTISEVFRYPPSESGFDILVSRMQRTDGTLAGDALGFLLDIAGGTVYAPALIILQHMAVSVHIQRAAEELNAGIAYYTTDVRRRLEREAQLQAAFAEDAGVEAGEAEAAAAAAAAWAR